MTSDVARLAAQAAVPLAVAAVMARILGPHAVRLWDERWNEAERRAFAMRYARQVEGKRKRMRERAEKAKAARAAREKQERVAKEAAETLVRLEREEAQREALAAAQTETDAEAYIRGASRLVAREKDTRITDKKCRADELEKNRLAVGALLGAKINDELVYVGLAVPVVEREEHVTRVAYVKGHDSHDEHTLIERVVPRLDEPRAKRNLPLQFVSAMFLGDVRAIHGPTGSDLVSGFTACLSDSRKDLAAILDKPKSSTPLQRKTVTSDTYHRQETLTECVQRTLSELENDGSGEHAKREGTHVLPFEDRAVLVHIEASQQKALIAVADSNASPPVQFRITDVANARRKLEVLARARASSTLLNEYDYHVLLNQLLCDPSLECRVVGVIESANQPGPEGSDPHLSIRSLTVGQKGIYSHAPRGISFAYYNLLWVLGLAIGLQKRHVSKNDGETFVRIYAAELWGDLAGLDRALKQAALHDVRGTTDAPLVAALYSRCEWLDVSALCVPRSREYGRTVVELDCVVSHSRNRMPPREELDVGAVLTDLRSVSAWVRSPGVLVLIEIEGARRALVVLLSLKARWLLIEETAYEPQEGDHVPVVQIARFLCYLCGKVKGYARSLVRGMLARCARYAVKIAKDSMLDVTVDGSLDQYSVNSGATFGTCLPWAASEYCALLEEARGVARLLFASKSPYMASLLAAEERAKSGNQELDQNAEFQILTATEAREKSLKEAWERMVPSRDFLALGKKIRDIVALWIVKTWLQDPDGFAKQITKQVVDAIKKTVGAEFGSCPDGFEEKTIAELAEELKDAGQFGGGLGALRDAFKDENSERGAELYASALSELTRNLGEEDARRAMLGAPFLLRELDNKTQEDRVALLSTTYDGDTAVMRVQACVALALGRFPSTSSKGVVDKCRTQALKPTQERALRYLWTDARVAALNLTFWLLNVWDDKGTVEELDSPVATRPYVIGNSTSGIALFQFVGSSDYLKEVSRVPLFARSGGVGSQHEDMVANAEGVYVASRARLAVAPDETAGRFSPSDGAPWLRIVVGEMRPKLAHDVAELVKWAEFEETAGYACRTGRQAVRAYTMPLSRKAPSKATIGKLAEFARKCRLWAEGPYAALRKLLEGPKQPLVATGYLERAGSDVQGEWEERAFAYVTVAVLEGRTEELIARELETLEKAVFVQEEPRVTWAPPATRARLSRLEAGTRALPRTETEESAQTLVFKASDGLVGMLHGNLVRAGCAFDHWYKGLRDGKKGESELVFPCGLVIRGTDEGLTLVLPKKEMKDSESESKEMQVFVRGSEYWDLTFGAAVVPVGETRVERLVVVPGTRGSPKQERNYVTANSVLAPKKRRDPSAAIEHFRRADPFVVELDGAFVLPAGSTTTEDLVALFVAYGYAGSICATRLIPLVASRVGGAAAGDKILGALYGAPCPLSFYAVCAASYTALGECKEKLALKLGCDQKVAARELRAKMLWAEEPAEFVEGLEDAESRVRQRAMAPTVRYGDCERDFVRARLAEKARGSTDAKTRDLFAACEESYHHADAWKTALEASTGKFVRADQRARIAEILAERWAVVQMQMGFGKSSVIVPMLVARYLSRTEVRVVLVTQPAHLVGAAFRAVGSLVAAQPSPDPVYVLGYAEFRAATRESWADAKLVVVLSTSDLQRLVRDNPRLFYDNARAIAHIADEVDEESDPLKCEVIVEGAETRKHYDDKVAENIGAYYRAALELGSGEPPSTRGQEMKELERIDAKSAFRLESTRYSVLELVHKVEFGPAEDPEVYVAVPYVCANKPSTVATFSDIDVAINLLVMSLAKGIRASDVELVKRDIRAKFGHKTGARIVEMLENDKEKTSLKAYFATQIAMPRLRMSKRESSVSFVDLLGIAATFVGFSGTMGASVRVPDYESGDPRAEYAKLAREKSVPVHSHDESNKAVQKVLTEAEQIDVQGIPGPDRAAAVLAQIVERVGAVWKRQPKRMICVVDGSGEFGAFENDLETVQKTFKDILNVDVGYFEAGQVVKPEARVRYYSHRDARGVDSEMDADTVGFVAIWTSSRYSEVAQAVYRLRGIGKGQTVELVVARDGQVDDFGLVDELIANEADHEESAEYVVAGQLAHAIKRKETAASFERDVTIYDQDMKTLQAMRTSEKQQTQTRQQVSVQVRNPNKPTSCFTADRSILVDAHPTLANGEKTVISEDLRALRVSLSPFLTSSGSGYINWKDEIKIRRRAFAVVADDDGLRLVVMALAEVWTRYRYEKDKENGPYVAYSHDGLVLRGEPKTFEVPPGMVLLGRYLCDDQLSLLAEYQLLDYLRATYAEKRANLQAVLSCLWGTTFLLEPRALIEAERVGEAMDKVQQKGEQKVVEHIRKEMFGGVRALDAIIRPYVSEMYASSASAAFGKRRFV